MSAAHWLLVAEKAYRAYQVNRTMRVVDGADVPPWATLSEAERDAWVDAAKAAVASVAV